ncbi:MAG: hypothetical protein RQ736_03530 [Thiogranum sp.]|nr:hypothetical protein [Thiogranum sp.]
MHSDSHLALLLWLMMSATGAVAADVQERYIEDPRSFWTGQGFTSMLPSIRLPTTHNVDDLIHVWLRVPEGRSIDAEYLPGQSRWVLVFPPGTHSDRVEYFRIAGAPPDTEALFLPAAPLERDNWSVVDVRGTEIHADGQSFHVLRPVSGAPQAPLRGWSWRRGNSQAQQLATERLLEFTATAARPGGRPPLDRSGRQQLARLNDCAHCHTRDKPRRLWLDQEVSMERATDAHGFFVPQAVLSDDCVVANHRPRDLNSEDPFVQVRCGDRPARLETRESVEVFVCPDQRVPIGYRDVGAGLAAGHDYTRQLCESRRWLYERMTDTARAAFTGAFAVCGIGNHPESQRPNG